MDLKPDWILVFETESDAKVAAKLLSEEGLGTSIVEGTSKPPKPAYSLLLVRVLGPVSGSRNLECAKKIPFQKFKNLIDKFPAPLDRCKFKPNYFAPLSSDSEISTIRQQFGDDVATVFQFSNRMTSSLLPPAIFGLIVNMFLSNDEYTQHVLMWTAFPIASYLYFEWHKIFYQEIRDPVVRIKCVDYGNTEEGARSTFRFVYGIVASSLLMLYLLGLVFLLACEIFCTSIYNGPMETIVQLIPVGGSTVLLAIYGIIFNLVTKQFSQIEDHPNEQDAETTNSRRQFALLIFIAFTPFILSVYLYFPLAKYMASILPLVVFGPLKNVVDLNPKLTVPSMRLLAQAKYFSVRQPLTGIATGFGLPFVLYVYKYFAHKEGSVFAKEQAKTPFDVQGQLQTSALTFALAYILFPVWPLSFAAAVVISVIRKNLLLLSLKDFSRRPIETGTENSLVYLRTIIPLSTFLAYSIAYNGSTTAVKLALRGAVVALISYIGVRITDKFDDIPQVVRRKIAGHDDPAQDALWK